jgi:hypothetical protein
LDKYVSGTIAAATPHAAFPTLFGLNTAISRASSPIVDRMPKAA